MWTQMWQQSLQSPQLAWIEKIFYNMQYDMNEGCCRLGLCVGFNYIMLFINEWQKNLNSLRIVLYCIWSSSTKYIWKHTLLSRSQAFVPWKNLDGSKRKCRAEQSLGDERRGKSTGACNELISCSVSSSPLIYYYRLTLRESYTLCETVKKEEKQKRAEVDVWGEGGNR